MATVRELVLIFSGLAGTVGLIAGAIWFFHGWLPERLRQRRMERLLPAAMRGQTADELGRRYSAEELRRVYQKMSYAPAVLCDALAIRTAEDALQGVEVER